MSCDDDASLVLLMRLEILLVAACLTTERYNASYLLNAGLFEPYLDVGGGGLIDGRDISR